MQQSHLNCTIKVEPSLIAHSVLVRNNFITDGFGATNSNLQAEFVAGRISAAYALKQLQAQNLIVERKNNIPHWPQGFCGSISHKKNIAYALAASNKNWRSLGLDVEYIFNNVQATKLASKILTTTERDKFPINELNVTLIFSLKEALFKALYPLTATKFYWQNAQVLALTKNLAQLELLTNLSAEFKTGFKINAEFKIRKYLLLTMLAV